MPTVKSIKHDWLFGKRSNDDIIEFLVSNELPLRGAIDTVDKIDKCSVDCFCHI